MPAKKKGNVNLDALIQREDFAASDDNINIASKIASISINDLRDGSGFFLASVRKPDFQRETADWDKEKLVRFIKSFVDGEFIPAVILWRSQSGFIFVIDGSHRLSTLIAWVNDDYGDKQFSLDAYEGEVPEEQRNIAKSTRDKVNTEIGQYRDFYAALSSKHPDPEIIVKARHLASRALPIQWIDGDVDTAERSFFNINQQAVPIDPTELKLLQKRKNSNCIVARAIVKGGKGHKYWHNFSIETQESIEHTSETVYDLLFEPVIERPMKTLDIPICDKSNNALMLVFDFVSSINEGKDEIDTDGQASISCLERALKAVQLFNSKYVGSYGLHPIVYCYSNKGNFRPASFYGSLEFIKALKQNANLLAMFIKYRHSFEDYIFYNDYIVQRIIDSQRRGTQSAKHISDYFFEILALLNNGIEKDNITASISSSRKYGKFISANTIDVNITNSSFSTSSKSEIFIMEAYKSAPRCAICGGILHTHSISIDHITRVREGGLGTPDNGQLTHPYCNTGVKN